MPRKKTNKQSLDTGNADEQNILYSIVNINSLEIKLVSF